MGGFKVMLGFGYVFVYIIVKDELYLINVLFIIDWFCIGCLIDEVVVVVVVY